MSRLPMTALAKAALKEAALVNGQWLPAATAAATIPVLCPATQREIGAVPNCGKAETDAAIAGAAAAFDSWKREFPKKRSAVLMEWARLMRVNMDAIAEILSMENGKSLAEAKGETEYAAQFVDWYAGEAERVYGDVINVPKPGARAVVLKQPVGVVGVVTPWNFPAAMITRACAGALAAGCTVVVKPSDLTPLTATTLAALAQQAGVPDGALSIVTGDAAPIGEALMASDAVRKITFTGSTRTGKLLLEQAAKTVKRTTMELGGNAPFIVFEDADLDNAAASLMMAKMRSAGQICIAANRIYVHESVYESFIAKVAEKVAQTKMGSGRAPGVTLGPVMTHAAAKNITRVVDDAVQRGASIVPLGNPALDRDTYADHLVSAEGEEKCDPAGFVPPTLLRDVTNDAAACCEEIFGPVIPFVKFASSEKDQAIIAQANAVKVGLAAYVFTENYRRHWRLMEELQFGMVAVNEGGLSAPSAPFGGVKESGMGRDGGRQGIDCFVDTKYTLIGGNL